MVGQVHGMWGNAEKVPGTAALNNGGAAEITSVSYASAGNCSADGDYTDSSGHHQAFVVSQVNGAWGKAEEIPGTATLKKGHEAGDEDIKADSAVAPWQATRRGRVLHRQRRYHRQAFLVSRN